MAQKTFLLLLTMAALAVGCSSSQEVDDFPRKAVQDPIVEEQAYKNAKLARQTPAQMSKSLKVPAITYEFDSVRPPDEAYPILDKIVTVMTDNPNLHLIVEGHADVVGSDEYNYWLAGARAAAMKSYLVSRGINAERIRIHSHGKDRPITLDNSSAGRKTNRRVEFTFTTRKWQAIY